MKLFNEIKRTRVKQSSHTESNYCFLNESSWKWVDYYRNQVEEWYSRFPDDLDFYRQFTSRKDWHHASAFFELYTFTLFSKLGFKVSYHGSIGSRKIDLVLMSDSIKILIDCVLSGEPNQNQSIERIEKQIEDIIEEVQSPFYWIAANFIRTSDQTPKLSRIRSNLQSEIASLNLEIGETKTMVWSDEHWIIEFSFFKKDPPDERSLGSVVSSQRGGFVDGPSMSILRRTLNSKRGSSYDVRCPYIIAVNSYNLTLYDELIKGVLFGDMNISGFTNNLFVEHPFFYKDRPQNTSVSGILLVRGLYSSNMGIVNIALWENPWSKYPIPQELKSLSRHVPKLNNSNEIEKIEFIQGLKPWEILEIEERYFDYDH